MFHRPEKTYDFDVPSAVRNILNDPANPLNRISEIIPDNAKVLDIGAGNGILAHVLKEKCKGLVIDGIEPDPYAAKIAGKSYRNFYTSFAQDFRDMISAENYDYIIMADVIEHVNDPLGFLQDICSIVKAKTKIILSVPNVAFGAVRIALLNGDFNYVDSGLLERTHLRFFTLHNIKLIVSEMNMNIEKLYFLERDIFTSEIDLKKYRPDPCSIFKIFRDRLSWTYQFLLVLSSENVMTEEKHFGKIPEHPMLNFIISNYIKRKN